MNAQPPSLEKFSLQVDRISKSFGSVKAIRNLSLLAEAGKIIGLLGPNGAGKSTSLRIISGLIPADSGSVYINNISVAESPIEAKKFIGFMSENNPLPPNLRVKEYLKFRAKIKGIPSKTLSKRLNEVYDLCELPVTVQSKMISALSKGYRQRVGIADALIADPPLIILDEPTVGLDPRQIINIRNLLNNIKQNKIILFSSHVLSEVDAISDEVIIMNQGQIVAKGNPEALKQSFKCITKYQITAQNITNLNTAQFKEELSQIASMFEIKALNPDSIFIYLETEDKNNESTNSLVQLFQKYNLRITKFNQTPSSLQDVFILATENYYPNGDEFQQIAC